MFAVYQEPSFLYLRTSSYLSVSLLFFAALVWGSPERVVPAMSIGLVIAAAIAALVGILGYFSLIPNAEAFAVYGRATGPYKDPNVFGPSLIFPALYLVHRLATRRAREMLWTLPLLMLLILALFLSFSRGAWMDFAVAGLVFMGLSFATAPAQERNRLTGLTLILSLCVALGIAWALSRPDVRTLFLQRLAFAQDYDSGEGGRFDNMLDAFKMALTYQYLRQRLRLGRLYFARGFCRVDVDDTLGGRPLAEITPAASGRPDRGYRRLHWPCARRSPHRFQSLAPYLCAGGHHLGSFDRRRNAAVPAGSCAHLLAPPLNYSCTREGRSGRPIGLPLQSYRG